MLSLVTAAEHQYRHEARTRDREIAVRAAIRERRVVAPIMSTPAPTVQVQASRDPRRARAAWARPIGIRDATECTSVACATA
jgi:hypothetical protein